MKCFTFLRYRRYKRHNSDEASETPPSAIAKIEGSSSILIMPLSYSIAEGLAVGFITYPLIKGFQGKLQETTITMWILAGVFILRFGLKALNLTD